MRILIIGDGNSVHICNFIKVVLSDLNKAEITLFDMNPLQHTNTEAYDYYTKSNVILVSDTAYANFAKTNSLKKLPKLRLLVQIIKLSVRVRTLGEFDYCIMHFVDKVKALISIINCKKYKRIISVFWGSDLLRNNGIGGRIFSKLFKKCYKIIFNTENMKRHFSTYYGSKFDYKSEVIKFPIVSFSTIENLECQVTREVMKFNMDIPLDKYIIVCGHAGHKDEQYEQLIEAISCCDETVLQRCYFVFPMTYGPTDLIENQHQVMNLMKQKGISGKVLCDFLIQEEVLQIMICADLHITVIKTDAFSGVMQENLYTGSLVIYGKWLNYYELESSGIYAQPIDSINDVTKALEYAISNYETIKLKLSDNKELISNISAPSSIKDVWWNKVFCYNRESN